jgi:solute carrier family 50 protein (sugar transporter)
MRALLSRDLATQKVYNTLKLEFFLLIVWCGQQDLWGKHGVYAQRSAASLATGFPYFSGFFAFLLWSLFTGLHRPTMLLQPFLVNLLGTVMNLSYALCYVYFSRSASDIKYAIGGLIAVGITMGAYVATDDPEFIGYGAATFNIILYGAPLAALTEVRRSRSVKKMPLLPVVMALVSSLSWLAYGFYIVKYQIIVANICGVLLSVSQLVVYRTYSRVTDAEEGENTLDSAINTACTVI